MRKSKGYMPGGLSAGRLANTLCSGRQSARFSQARWARCIIMLACGLVTAFVAFQLIILSFSTREMGQHPMEETNEISAKLDWMHEITADNTKDWDTKIDEHTKTDSWRRGWEASSNKVYTHYRECEKMRGVWGNKGDRARGFLHLLVDIDRGDRKSQDIYEENIWRFLSRSSDKLDYYLTIMGEESQEFILGLLQHMRNPCNIVHIEFTSRAKKGDICEHQRVVNRARKLLSAKMKNYQIFFFSNDGVRPIGMDSEGEWISRYEKLLSGNSVLCGPMMSCEVSPHVQTHFFAMSKSGVRFLRDIDCHNNSLVDMYNREIRLSNKVLASGHKISSMMYGEVRLHESLQEKLRESGDFMMWDHLSPPAFDVRELLAKSCYGKSNPSICFKGNPGDLVFMKWGGTLAKLDLLPTCDISSPRPSSWSCEPTIKANETLMRIGKGLTVVCDEDYQVCAKNRVY